MPGHSNSQLIVIFLFIIPCYCYFAAWHGHWQHHYVHTESWLIITSFYNCFPTCCQFAVMHCWCWCHCTVPASWLLFPFSQVPVFNTSLLLPLLLLSAISSLLFLLLSVCPCDSHQPVDWCFTSPGHQFALADAITTCSCWGCQHHLIVHFMSSLLLLLSANAKKSCSNNGIMC